MSMQSIERHLGVAFAAYWRTRARWAGVAATARAMRRHGIGLETALLVLSTKMAVAIQVQA